MADSMTGEGNTHDKPYAFCSVRNKKGPKTKQPRSTLQTHIGKSLKDFNQGIDIVFLKRSTAGVYSMDYRRVRMYVG